MGKIIQAIRYWFSSSELVRDLRYNQLEIKRNKCDITYLKKEMHTTENKLSYLKEKLERVELLNKQLEDWENTLNKLINNKNNKPNIYKKNKNSVLK